MRYFHGIIDREFIGRVIEIETFSSGIGSLILTQIQYTGFVTITVDHPEVGIEAWN
jgi:hypothetical protein